jgi:hypothetical protein
MDDGCNTFEIPNLKLESSFNTDEIPSLKREGRDFNDSLFLPKESMPLFGFLIFVGRETM